MRHRHLILAVLVLVVVTATSVPSVAGNCGHVIGYRVVGPMGAGPVGAIGMGMPMAAPFFRMPLPSFYPSRQRPVPHLSRASVSPPAQARTKAPSHKDTTNANVARETRGPNAAERRQLLEKKTAYVLDAATGDIRWNSVLQGEAFAEARAALAFQLPGNVGSAPQLTGEEYRAAVTAIAEMKQTLAHRIHEIRPETYCETSRFLVDLRTQLKLRTVSTALHVGD